MKLKDALPTATIKESSLSRIWQLVQEDKYSFAVISASRGELSATENQTRYAQLKQDVRAAGHGFIEMKGGYVETVPGTNERVDVTEDSILVVGIDKQKALEIGAKYQQESILYKDAQGFQMIKADPANPQVEMSFQKGNDKNNLAIAGNSFIQYFSALKKGAHAGKKFAYVSEGESWNSLKEMKAVNKNYKRKWTKILTIN